ncbi:hypothetical protein GALL_479470 [mine drainage metagenome]|uniref:Uncharacterized protein n=1 Tax=mine drainage metagenome TaxID=410659 RepID=A0A1J5PGV6_9ZZZZ
MKSTNYVGVVCKLKLVGDTCEVPQQVFASTAATVFGRGVQVFQIFMRLISNKTKAKTPVAVLLRLAFYGLNRKERITSLHQWWYPESQPECYRHWRY